MNRTQTLSPVVCVITWLMVCLGGLVTPAHAQALAPADQSSSIRQTIPNPQAAGRMPLTSDQLNTASTRLIDARRGFRPFSTVLPVGQQPGQQRFAPVGYVYGSDDNFGISRPVDRPFSYAMRTPRTGVTLHTRPTHTRADAVRLNALRRAATTERSQTSTRPTDRRSQPARIRIHRDREAMPEHSGAVLITSDGRVIQIGD